jgi:GntR family transcriptional regulator, rspAB operon transcriptional repressor
VITGAAAARRGSADAPNLAEQAYRQIHGMIVRCELAPSAEVTQNELVASTGLGRSPVREALARLTAEGLMVSRPRFGYQVAPITLADIREIFGLREIVESAAAELACQLASDADLDRLDALCVAPGPAEDVETIMSRNRNFHLLIGRLSGNRRLADVIDRLVWESDRFFCYQAQSGYPVQHVPTGHQRLVQVLRTRDPAGARLLAASDARSAAANLIELIVSARDPRPWPVSG